MAERRISSRSASLELSFPLPPALFLGTWLLSREGLPSREVYRNRKIQQQDCRRLSTDSVELEPSGCMFCNHANEKECWRQREAQLQAREEIRRPAIFFRDRPLRPKFPGRAVVYQDLEMQQQDHGPLSTDSVELEPSGCMFCNHANEKECWRQREARLRARAARGNSTPGHTLSRPSTSTEVPRRIPPSSYCNPRDDNSSPVVLQASSKKASRCVRREKEKTFTLYDNVMMIG